MCFRHATIKPTKSARKQHAAGERVEDPLGTLTISPFFVPERRLCRSALRIVTKIRSHLFAGGGTASSGCFYGPRARRSPHNRDSEQGETAGHVLRPVPYPDQDRRVT